MLTSMAGRGLSTMAWIFVERSPRLTPIDFASPFRAADAKGFHCPPSARRGHASRRRVPLRRHLHPSSICQSLAQISVRIVPCRVAIVGSSYPLQNSRRERRLQCDALRPAAIFCSQITFRISARRPEMSPALVIEPDRHAVGDFLCAYVLKSLPDTFRWPDAVASHTGLGKEFTDDAVSDNLPRVYLAQRANFGDPGYKLWHINSAVFPCSRISALPYAAGYRLAWRYCCGHFHRQCAIPADLRRCRFV